MLFTINSPCITEIVRVNDYKTYFNNAVNVVGWALFEVCTIVKIWSMSGLSLLAILLSPRYVDLYVQDVLYRCWKCLYSKIYDEK